MVAGSSAGASSVGRRRRLARGRHAGVEPGQDLGVVGRGVGEGVAGEAATDLERQRALVRSSFRISS